MRRLLVVRPQPGNRATVERAREMGLDAASCPLFAIEPVAWSPPAPGADFILFTSANALRHGGAALSGFTTLDALAVGPATADAARAAGFRVVMAGNKGVEALLAALPGARQILHLAGAEHHAPATRHSIETIVVYRSVALADAVIPSGALVAMVHSPRAGSRLAKIAAGRASIAIAAISSPAAAACGTGWASIDVADETSDRALLALAARLCQD